MKKRYFMFVFIIILVMFVCPREVEAMSAETAAKKMNDYVYSTIFNNKWNVENKNSSYYDIKIQFSNVNDTDFKEVLENIPTKLFNSSIYKVDVYIVDCGSNSSCDRDSINWNNSIEFSMIKKSSSNIFLEATDVSPDVYNKIIDGKVYYEINTNKKGIGGDVRKSGNFDFSNDDSQFDESKVDTTVGNLNNPFLVGVSSTINVPGKNSSFWNGKTDKCYYFEVDFSSEDSSKTTARYEISPIDESYIINWINNGEIFGSVYRDENERELFGLSKDKIYGICMYMENEDYYGKRVTFKFRDTNRIIITNGTDRAEAEIQYGEDAVGDEWDFIGDGVNSDDFGEIPKCEDIISTEEGSFGWMLNTILNYIKIIGPILVVLLSSIDFVNATLGFDEKAMKEAQNKLIIRLVAALALFLVPTLIQLLFSFINQTTCAL